MNFDLPSTEELAELASHLLPQVVKGDGKFWFVKYRAGSRDLEKRDMLAYLLGKDICNICEVKLISDDELQSIKGKLSLSEDSDKNNTFLIRLAGSYSITDLPCKTIEEAVARELVFSVWIRRRDTHSLNRVYIDGIPVFFDHETAFLAEGGRWAHSTMFFRDNPDYGHPGYWRIKTLPTSEKMETMKSRNTPNQNDRAHHYVYNIEEFKNQIPIAEERVRDIASSDLRDQIIKAGFNQNDTEHIYNFLKNNLVTLSSDIEQLKEIIFLP